MIGRGGLYFPNTTSTAESPFKIQTFIYSRVLTVIIRRQRQ